MHRGVNPSVFVHQRKLEGAFLCEQCEELYPMSLKRVQENRWVCAPTCYRPLTATDIARLQAEAVKECQPSESQWLERPVLSVFAEESLTRLFTPSSVSLSASGSSTDVVVDGQNLRDVTFTSEGPVTVTVESAADDGSSVTIRLATSEPAKAGDYSLFGSHRQPALRKNFVKVR